ncbi:MAG: hypothetical protein BWY15_01090 [Firmicutes bacterium ADurb.Bin193]|nr:MAG: hypothetical protein BWY15_01090 [Firmicutes bacterium ADurb.Bin193]
MSGSIRKSVAKIKIVHGVTIRRLPIGAYLAALESICELPESLLSRVFPDVSASDAISRLKNITSDTLLQIIGRGAAALPDELIGFFAALLEIPAEKIRDELTPSEFMDVLSEFWRLNDLSNFMQRARAVIAAVLAR